MNRYDVIVVGAGAAGMVSAIKAARDKKKVLLLEKLPKIGAKLKATGGGRCNLTNTLESEEFMSHFGRDGRFMRDALNTLDQMGVIDFFSQIGVETHAPDGFRVFPTSHSSMTIISALESELENLGIEVLCSQRVIKLIHDENSVSGVETTDNSYMATAIIIATGGLGYPTLGADGDGYAFATSVGHKVSELHPAMMPLITKESWVENCRADTIAKAEIRINLPKAKKVVAHGDLIFTKNGIRGPVVLDLAREITPLISKYGEVPLLINLTKGMNEEQIRVHLKNENYKNSNSTILEILSSILPSALSTELCKISGVDPKEKYNKIAAQNRDLLIKNLTWTPLSVVGHDGFKMAMITRGGVSLKEIRPNTMESKLIDGLYFCGEVMNLDGPCGGYNLQWAFSSGYLAGSLKK